MDYLRAFYDILVECRQDNGMCWETWRAHASDNADLWPILKGGQMVGGVFFKGHTVHIAIKPEWQGRWITKGLLAAYRTWTHECDIVATPPHDNAQACALAERLGFKRQGQQGQFNIYVKERVSCPQQ